MFAGGEWTDGDRRHRKASQFRGLSVGANCSAGNANVFLLLLMSAVGDDLAISSSNELHSCWITLVPCLRLVLKGLPCLMHSLECLIDVGLTLLPAKMPKESQSYNNLQGEDQDVSLLCFGLLEKSSFSSKAAD